MKNYHLHIPEGVKDLIWEGAELKQCMSQQILSIFTKYSYHLIETPTFEYLDVFNMDYGTVQRPQLYQFLNRQGELVALRNDMTCAIARVAATQNQGIPYPQRYCYLANSFRYPERYQGKSHEFTQVGIELIGNDTTESDAEVIKLAIQSIETVGIKDFIVHLGNASFFKSLFEDMRITPRVQHDIYRAIESKDGVELKRILVAERVDEKHIQVISQLIQRTGGYDLLKQIRDSVEGVQTHRALDYLEELYDVLKDYGLAHRVRFDLSILSYARYYTGVMFQIVVPGIGTAVCEGGRYDALLEKYGKDLPAVGFGLNIDLLLEKIQQQAPSGAMNSRSTLIVYHPKTRALALEVAEHFRKQGMVIENYFDQDIEAAIAYAQAIGLGGILYFQSKERVGIYDMAEQKMQYRDPIALF